MKTVVSFLLGAVVLFGAATLGLQSASANAANAKARHDKNYWRHHRHHRHQRHRKNHLSY